MKISESDLLFDASNSSTFRDGLLPIFRVDDRADIQSFNLTLCERHLHRVGGADGASDEEIPVLFGLLGREEIGDAGFT